MKHGERYGKILVGHNLHYGLEVGVGKLEPRTYGLREVCIPDAAIRVRTSRKKVVF
jgi:hypothetical protein